MPLRLTILAVLTILASAAPTFAQPLRVMTFNIHAGHGDLARVAAVIRAADVDVVALQEVDVHWSERSDFADQATQLAEATGMDVRFAPIYSQPGATADAASRQYGVALLSRLPIVASRNHSMTRLSTQREDDAAAPAPGFLQATIHTSRGGIEVFTTHLDFRRDPRVRRTQVAEMLAITRSLVRPVILMGDFNATPDAPELQPLFEHFTDAWQSTGRGATYPATAPDRRIDLVLLSEDLLVVRSSVVETDASDHLPVITELEIRR